MSISEILFEGIIDVVSVMLVDRVRFPQADPINMTFLEDGLTFAFAKTLYEKFIAQYIVANLYDTVVPLAIKNQVTVVGDLITISAVKLMVDKWFVRARQFSFKQLMYEVSVNFANIAVANQLKSNYSMD